jgi:hypothetical protein
MPYLRLLTYIPLTLPIPEGVAVVSQIFLLNTHVLPKLVSVKNTADVTGGKPSAVLLQCISGVTAINPLVAFHDIHGRKREDSSSLFYFVPDTTPDLRVLLSCHELQCLTND